jgi:hypothetical protein
MIVEQQLRVPHQRSFGTSVPPVLIDLLNESAEFPHPRPLDKGRYVSYVFTEPRSILGAGDGPGHLELEDQAASHFD